jgi:hypothetical protein
VLIASENVAVMLAVVTTPVAGPVGGVALGSGSVFIITTVGGPGAAQAIPAAESIARAIVVNSSSVFIMIFLSPKVFRALRDRFRGAFTLKILSLFVRLSS